MTVNIPEEVILAADQAAGRIPLEAAYHVVANWARKEALREAELAARGSQPDRQRLSGYYGFGDWTLGRESAIMAIRALSRKANDGH